MEYIFADNNTLDLIKDNGDVMSALIAIKSKVKEDKINCDHIGIEYIGSKKILRVAIVFEEDVEVEPIYHKYKRWFNLSCNTEKVKLIITNKIGHGKLPT